MAHKPVESSVADPDTVLREKEDEASEEKETQQEQTRVLLAVSQSTRGYPHPSQSSMHALEWTLQKLIHRSCRSGFKMLILHVEVPDEDGLDELDSIYATAADFKEAEEKHLKQSIRLLESFVRKCHEAEVPVQAWVKIGDPKEVICNEVLRVKPDLLILGSRGLGPLQRIFVGGVSSYCSKKADCPVLVIRRRPEDMPKDASED